MPKTSSRKSAKVAKKAAARRVTAQPTLLAGGNPQIAKADGDATVQAYIAAMPGWKSALGHRVILWGHYHAAGSGGYWLF